MRAKNLVSVKFIRKNSPYNVNEIAGFPPEIAKRLVDRKRAVYNVPESEKPAEEPVKAEAAAPPQPPEEPAPKPKAAPKKKPATKKKAVAKSKK